MKDGTFKLLSILMPVMRFFLSFRGFAYGPKNCCQIEKLTAACGNQKVSQIGLHCYRTATFQNLLKSSGQQSQFFFSFYTGQISRLHLILKPFMLRRIKKDVENELTDKVEVLLYCPLTLRQKLLYRGLKQKIRIEELLQNLGGSGRAAAAAASASSSSNSSGDNAIASSLMNLVMQFRKVRRRVNFQCVLKSLCPS